MKLHNLDQPPERRALARETRREAGRAPTRHTDVAPVPSGVSLDDKYTAESGQIVISGVQALVRLTLEQRRLDQAHGHDTAAYVSGYQGSPLGGLDRELARASRHLEPARVVFRPGVNEELAATAVGGTQLLGQLGGARVSGVTGYWYGKNPGFDRAADAIRHATLSGTDPLGGAVAWIGDDPSSKSSTVPSSCEAMCRSLAMPLLAPASVAELLTLGLHAVAISRSAGLWTGMKIVADIADASATIDAAAARREVADLTPRERFEPPVLLPPTNLDAELDLLTARLERVHHYANEYRLNRVIFEPRRPRFGLVAAGQGYAAVRRALDDLGLGDDALDALGVRVVQLSMPWPLERGSLRRQLGDLETLLVVEDKLPFVEAQIKEALYRQPREPLVLGKEDEDGGQLMPVHAGITADHVARALRGVLPLDQLPERARLRTLAAPPAPLELSPAARRTPYFCSGCPHNTSTRAQPDELVGAGIGCHIMVAIDDGERRGKLLGMPQMGGEGAQWFGLAPFTEEPHFIQNLGDGTFYHSGSLAIRAAIAAGVNVTYRLLYNDAVAMTGGQAPPGRMSLPALTRALAAEGVKRIIITTPEPRAYRRTKLDPIAEVRDRDELQDAQRELVAVAGVTVLLHDDRCATEKRRLRKRGELATPAARAWINERVCEGCGDCAEQSTCLSVLPVETEFGAKKRIHQSSCNQDMTCLKGDCPSFVLVTPRAGKRSARKRVEPPTSLPEPVLRGPADVLVRMTGVGGTGVMTVSAILQMAAQLDGRHAAGVEQTGLAQKGGPVLSDLRIAGAPIVGQVRASSQAADVLLGFDLLGAVAPATLEVLDRNRTVAILNTDVMPTAAMVTDPNASGPEPKRLVRRIELATRSQETFTLAAESVAERLFGDHMPANMLVVGAAFQRGCLPLAAAAIERAIQLNGAAVAANVAAFRWGRTAVADPASLDAALRVAAAAAPKTAPPLQAIKILDELEAPEALRAALELRVEELAAYQDARYARRYARDVMRVGAVVTARAGDAGLAVADAYARGLFKLMAYKDEYEVARLHLDTVERARLDAEFGSDAKLQILLHPPAFRALGLKRKLRFARTAKPLLRLLRAGRRLRGTPLDPFGYARVRRVERALIDEYRQSVDRALATLSAENAAIVAQVAQLPNIVRGYERIKLSSIERMRSRRNELLDQLTTGSGAAIAVTRYEAQRR